LASNPFLNLSHAHEGDNPLNGALPREIAAVEVRSSVVRSAVFGSRRAAERGLFDPRVTIRGGIEGREPALDLVAAVALTRITGVGPMVRSPVLMVERPSQPDKSLADFIARAKANPDQLTYASAGVGTTTHLGAALFLQQAGLKVMHVPYKGNGAAMPDVIAGRVTMIFEAYGSGAGKVKAGQLKALGVTSTKRLASLPDVPTIAEQGVPGYSYYLWLGLLAPAGTPKEVVAKIHAALGRAMATPPLREQLATLGIEPTFGSPEAFAALIRSEIPKWAEIVKKSGATAE